MKSIPVGDKFALVNDEDFHLVSKNKWRLFGPRGSTYYAIRGGGPRMKTEYMHRVILSSVKEVDHVNGNGLDNRRENLREATRTQQNANRRIFVHSSNYKGVSRYGNLGKWRARLHFEGVEHHLGVFQDEAEAALAYNAKAKEVFGEYALLNEVAV